MEKPKGSVLSPLSPGQQEMPAITDEGFGRFSKNDVITLRIFKDNDVLLTVLTKIMLQSKMTDSEKKMAIDSFKGNDSLCKVVSRIFAPEENESGLVAGTRWQDRKYSDLLMAEVKPVVLARQDSIKFTDFGLKRLKNIVTSGDVTPLETNVDIGMMKDYEDCTPEEVKRAVVAFQDVMTFVSNHVGVIGNMANMRDETAEEKASREKKNSTK